MLEVHKETGMKRKSHVEAWFILDFEGTGEVLVLCGTVRNDPRHDPTTTEFADGHHIVTSAITAVHWNDGVIETRNTLYSLGTELTELNDYWKRKLGWRKDYPMPRYKSVYGAMCFTPYPVEEDNDDKRKGAEK